MIASVVANVSGLMTGGLHVFLRSKTLSTIGPRQKWESERNKLKAGIRVYNGDDDYENHMMNPVGRAQSLRRLGSTDNLVPEKGEEERIESPSGSPTYANPLRSNAVWQQSMRSPLRAPEPVQVSTYQTPKTHARKRSYSLFPSENNGNTKSITLLPATTYAPGSRIADDDDMMFLRPPPSIHPQGIRHRRDSSLASSATVQIGLRLSNVDDMPPLNSQYFQNNASVSSLDCPLERDAQDSKRPSPLTQVDRASDSGMSDSEEDETLVSSPVRPEKDVRMKTLPSVPKLAMPRQSQLKDRESEQLTLSPAVYRPESPQKTRVTSPQGVGFNNPAQRKKAPFKCLKQNCQCDGQHDKRDWI